MLRSAEKSIGKKLHFLVLQFRSVNHSPRTSVLLASAR
jgi:hypothetical protein